MLEKFNNKAISWSYYSSFLYNKERWFAKYYEGIEQPESEAMRFGKEFGEKVASDPNFTPEVKRYKHFEECLQCEFSGMKLLGYMDTSLLSEKKFRELKTGNNKNPWTQKRVDEHDQITMYALMIYVVHGIMPEDLDIHLDWVPTLEADFESLDDFINGMPKVRRSDEKIKTFKTKRTLKQCLKFGAKLKKTHKEMRQYVVDKLALQ